MHFSLERFFTVIDLEIRDLFFVKAYGEQLINCSTYGSKIIGISDNFCYYGAVALTFKIQLHKIE